MFKWTIEKALVAIWHAKGLKACSAYDYLKNHTSINVKCRNGVYSVDE